MKEYEDEKIEETKAIRISGWRQEIRKNVDLSVLNLSFGILESSPSISPKKVFYLERVCECLGIYFLTLSVAFYSPRIPFLEIQRNQQIAANGVPL